MTYKTLLRAGSAAALALMAFGCNNDKITALNQNPNSPEDVPAGPLFTNAARNTINTWFGGGWYDLRAASWATQQLAEIQYNDEDVYARMHGADTESDFNNSYAGELKDLQQVINKATAAKTPGTYAPAIALRTLGFAFLTDSWGDVPYFTALKGDSVGGSLSPAYDKQSAIYADFFKVLDQASKDLVGATNTLGANDPIYAGSPAKWQKFINSLRLRLALRVINKDPALASTQLAAAINAPGGLILTNADNARFPWPGDGVYNNPWSNNLGGRDDWRMSNRLMDLMLANSDPRIPIYAQPTPADATKYAGSPNGIAVTKNPLYFNVTSRPGVIFYKGKTSYGPTFGGSGASLATFVLTAAEVNFTLAEAAERGVGGLTPGQAAAYYNTGITQSLAQWSGVAPASTQISAAATATFLAQPGVVYLAGTPGLIQIAQQKWIALFTDGGNAWAEWRRTCRPATVVAGADATENEVPRRFEYGIRELTVNLASVDAVTATQGPNTLHSKVWWDVVTAAPTYPGASCGVKNGT
jgi:hypothetical protein